MSKGDIAGLVVWCIVLIVFIVFYFYFLRKTKQEEDKVRKAKRSMYDAWYDLAILYADLKNKELENKEEKQENE